MKKNKKTYYLLILDKSGSMASVIRPTVEGFNEQVQMIKNLQEKYPGQEIKVSLTTFNHIIDHDLFLKKPSDLKELQPLRPPRVRGNTDLFQNDKITYWPRGMTALYDAIGKSVRKLNKSIKDEIKNDEASAVVVIITDGHENSSEKYSYDEIKKMIARLERSKNWTFSYLGATPDAVNIARGMNINEHNALFFKKQNIKSVFADQLSESMDEYMKAKSQGKVSKKFLRKDND